MTRDKYDRTDPACALAIRRNFKLHCSIITGEREKKKMKKFLKRTDIVKTVTVQARGFFRLIEASKHTSTCVKKVIETNKTS